MGNSIKSISTAQIEDAMSKVLSELTGNTSSVAISELKFEVSAHQGLTGSETFYFSAKAVMERPTSDEPLPF